MKKCIAGLCLVTGLALPAAAIPLWAPELVSQASPAPLLWGEEQVRARVLEWFSLQDQAVRTEQLLALLDPTGFQLNFAEGEIHSAEDFNIWWHAFLHRCPNGSHQVSRVTVQALEDGFEARLDVDWTSQFGVTTSSFQRWLLRDNQGQPVIYRMHVVRI
jgi:hypothetical protein